MQHLFRSLLPLRRCSSLWRFEPGGSHPKARAVQKSNKHTTTNVKREPARVLTSMLPLASACETLLVVTAANAAIHAHVYTTDSASVSASSKEWR
jgi:hypothetical protein